MEDNTVNQNERKSLTEIVNIRDIYETNHFLNEVNQHLPSVSIPEFLLIVKYANVCDKTNVISLAKEFDAFDVIDGVNDYEELAKQWIEREDDLEISSELQPYFDYESYGRELAAEQEGQFMEDGCYVYLRNGYCMEEIIDIDENEPIEMGGM